jgi:hypothetical protein
VLNLKVNKGFRLIRSTEVFGDWSVTFRSGGKIRGPLHELVEALEIYGVSYDEIQIAVEEMDEHGHDFAEFSTRLNFVYSNYGSESINMLQ